jgi:hypothetical protein
MNKETLRMQMLAGIITESEYKEKTQEPINEIIGTILGVGAALALGKYAYNKFSNWKKDKNLQPAGKTEVVKRGNGQVVLTKYQDKRDGKFYWGLDTAESAGDPGYNKVQTLLFSDEKLPMLKNWISKGGGLGGGPTDMDGGRDYGYDQYYGPFKSDVQIQRGYVE